MNYEEKYKYAIDRAMNLFVTNNISATAVCEIFPELNESEEINYEKKYKKALEWMRSVYDSLHGATKEDAEHYFPELKENKSERVRKGLIKTISSLLDNTVLYHTDITKEEALAWLEKQGNKIVDCQQNHQDVKYPNGGIVMEDFNGGEGFYKLHLDYLSKKQVEEVEEMVRTWNKESKTSNENIKNCVEMCLTDANEQRFEDFGTTLKDCLAWLKKQGENKKLDADKVTAWLVANICDFDYYVKLFKKDFGLC